MIKPEKMKRLRFGIALLFVPVFLLFANVELLASLAPASTDGTVSFTVQTVTNGATYSPRNVLAIWVKDGSGNFIISRKVMAASRKQHLVKWVASSGNNVVNATTGATLSNHQTHTIAWDCRDVNGNLVADGNYEIWVEFTERNSNNGGAVGPSTRIAFAKGLDVVALTPPDESYFKNMQLTYTPVGVGYDEKIDVNLQFLSFPNPFPEKLNISFELPQSDYVNISVYDLGGKRMAELVNEVLPQGNNSFSWTGKTGNGVKLNPGVYFLRFVYQGRMYMQKIIHTD
jgi:flagellar hook assembly protein FlgD